MISLKTFTIFILATSYQLVFAQNIETIDPVCNTCLYIVKPIKVSQFASATDSIHAYYLSLQNNRSYLSSIEQWVFEMRNRPLDSLLNNELNNFNTAIQRMKQTDLSTSYNTIWKLENKISESITRYNERLYGANYPKDLLNE